ncbi:MAG: FAD-dependent oxidoreductase, partial [Candidatus Heimdallarchaeota archaeon]|nr:FAD-dependent oxidoreductase [Candidatus Heimdallarchaeota archaeon]
KKCVELFPWLKEDGLKGGGLYTDARADDSRLTIANVQSAYENKAMVANYVKAIDIENSDPIKYVSVKDMLSNHEFKIKCKTVVAVIGVWQDQLFTSHKKLPKIIPSTGSHFVIKQNLCNDRALGFIYQQAKSTGYIIPWNNHTIIGTTDIPFKGNLDNILPCQEDLDFLLSEVNRIIINENSITESDVFSAFAGARPLFYSKAEVTDISREFKIAELEDGILVVTGGKLTTYRLLAEKTVNKVCKKLKRRSVKCLTHKLPLPGSESDDFSNFYSKYYKKLSSMGFKDETVNHLLNTYGTRVKNILELIRKDESLKKKISESKPHIYAEIPYLVQNEYVRRIEDVFLGRLHLDLTLDNGFDCLDVIAHLLKESCNLSNVEIEDQIKEYKNYIKSIRDFK